MEKIYLVLAVIALSGCADTPSLLNTSALSSTGITNSTKSQMTTCMSSEAISRLRAGTLFNDTVSAAAKDIAATCTKRLALESMGITSEMQTEASDIITNLRALSGS